ncbi:MAG: hypothetical protein V7K89_11280 [Nostoc sp.]|uniref:hypothetical protein n=1 Tax=Nostoc sp. TaxID=1180 RepID=UPI002FFCD2BA
MGEREGDLDNSFQLPSHFRTDAAVYYRKNNLQVGVNLNNLFDVRYFESARNNLQVYAGEPFTATATVRYEF